MRDASMKVPPKRKGNNAQYCGKIPELGLNESPSQKEGKCSGREATELKTRRLNESPSQKEGKSRVVARLASIDVRPQ